MAPQPSAESGTPVEKKNTLKGLAEDLNALTQQLLLKRSFAVFPLLFLGGLLMNLTPCVYPMIPITLALLNRINAGDMGTPLASGEHHLATIKRRRRFMALFYGLGIVLVYAALGLSAGLTGMIFGSLLQNPWFTAAAAVFCGLGLTMLGLFDVSFLQQWAQKIPTFQNQPAFSAFILGGLSGAVAAPCTGPVLSALLLLISASKDPLQGLVFLGTFSSGFALPYVAAGLWAPTHVHLPRVGFLTNIVKIIFSSLMFALSLYFIKPFLGRLEFINFDFLFRKPSSLTLFIFVTLACCSLFLLWRSRHRQGFALATTCAIFTVFAFWGTLQVTSGFTVKNTPDTLFMGAKNEIKWRLDLNTAREEANQKNKIILVDLWAEWCAACHEMDADFWSQATVIQAVTEKTIPVKLDFTQSNSETESLSKSWGISGLPALVLLRVTKMDHGSQFQLKVEKVLHGKIPVNSLLEAL